MPQPRKHATPNDRLRAHREKVRREKGPNATTVGRCAGRAHEAIEAAADRGDAWAMQVRGRNPYETLQNIEAYAKGERGRLAVFGDF